MTFSPYAVANEFISISLDKETNDLTPMKMQKLVYFAHGWFLALTDESLISEAVQAWEFGPVVPSLYRGFREYGNQPITSLVSDTKWDKTSKQVGLTHPRLSGEIGSSAEFAKALVQKIWDTYGKYSPARLSNATHVPGSPWQRVYQPGVRGLSIPNELIKEYFKGLIDAR